MKKILVTGAGGFIAGELVKKLKEKGHEIVAVDKKPLTEWYQITEGVENLVLDLQYRENCYTAVGGCDKVFNLAADMGGMGFIENNKAECMLSVLTNTNLLRAAKINNVAKYLYSSSACIYNTDLQKETFVNGLKEHQAYPANPEDGYGWEKLFSERF